MSDNSKKMSLEERIVQTLKDDSLMKLVGDEDAITELVTRAIREALYQPVRLPQQYGGYEEKDSVVVTAARAAAKLYAETVAKIVAEELLADPANKKIIRDTLIDFLPLAIQEYWQNSMRGMSTQIGIETTNLIRSMKSAGDRTL